MRGPAKVCRLSSPTSAPSPPCRVCAAETRPAGVVHGSYSGRDYRLARCHSCGFSFIVDPWLDYAQIYDDRYYAGEGADPLVDYRFELEHPELSIRRYEWEGVARVVSELLGGPEPGRRWLDFGCGNGGLVRHLRDSRAADAFGFDEGSIAAEVSARGIPILTAEQLAAHEGSFD